MNRKVLLWLMALVIILPVLGGGGYYLIWDNFLRFDPVTITKPEDLAKIQKMLDQADYVSPHRAGPAIYVITYHNCKPCRAYQEQEFPKYDAIGADTRVIAFARADNQGLSQSTPAERSTVAELWLTRKWEFYQAWFSASDVNWKADGLPVADDDWARNAVVESSRSFAGQMGAILGANQVKVTYPLVIWRDGNNRMKVCACTDERSYHSIREDIGAPGMISTLPGAASFQLPSWLKPGSESSSAAPAASEEPAHTPIPAAPKPATAASSSAASDFGPDAH